MTFKRLMSAIIALSLMLVGTAALAETDSDQRIAELETQVEDLTAQLETAQAQIKEFEEQNYLVTFDGGFVTVEEAQNQYDYILSMYESYGYSVSGYEDYLRQEVMHMLAEQALLKVMGNELGFAEIDEQTMTTYKEEAQATYDENIEAYKTYFTEEGMTDEDIVAATVDYLETAGYTYDDILQSMVNTHITDALYDSITKDVAVTEADIQATYDATLAEDEASYASDSYSYEYARANGEVLSWNPEGYRTVKHVLIKFNDEQTAKYTELSQTITNLETQIANASATPEPAAAETATADDAATTPEPAAAETDTADDAAETDTAATAEPSQEPVDVAALTTQLGEAKASLETLYQELQPKADEVISRFTGGEAFDALMAEFGEDPGMQAEPAMSEGYYVSETSTLWESAFTEGAMSIAAVGEISQPVQGSNGIHIIYYLADVPAGAVALETIRDTVESVSLTDKVDKVYTDQVAAWGVEKNMEYYFDRFN